MAAVKRVPAAERRRMLVEAGIGIARSEGGRAVTLARVAEACGVTKPIAYRLFGSLPTLLAQMERHVVAGYEAVVAEALERAAAEGATRREALDALARAYVRHSLGEGAVYDTVAAARTAAESAEVPVFALPDSYRTVAREVFGVPAGREAPVLAMFLGAADNLVAAVQAGLVAPEAAVDHLADAFAPLLSAGEEG